MNPSPDEQTEIVELRSRIKAAFPDFAFHGPITAVDGRQNDELDEQRALYGALMGKRWSEILPTFIDNYPDGVVLLTDEACSSFLPAWLERGLENAKVREFLVYMFSPREASEILDRRIRRLTSTQGEVLRAFLTYCVKFDPTQSIKEYARQALAYVTNLGNS